MIVHIKFQVHTKCLTGKYRGQYIWKKTSGFIGGGIFPLLGATETTSHSYEKWKVLLKDAWENFDNNGKKSFSYPEEQSQVRKEGVHLP